MFFSIIIFIISVISTHGFINMVDKQKLLHEKNSEAVADMLLTQSRLAAAFCHDDSNTQCDGMNNGALDGDYFLPKEVTNSSLYTRNSIQSIFYHHRVITYLSGMENQESDVKAMDVVKVLDKKSGYSLGVGYYLNGKVISAYGETSVTLPSNLVQNGSPIIVE